MFICLVYYNIAKMDQNRTDLVHNNQTNRTMVVLVVLQKCGIKNDKDGSALADLTSSFLQCVTVSSFGRICALYCTATIPNDSV